MSRKKQRQNEIEARSKRNALNQQQLKNNDIWAERQGARNNNSKSNTTGKLIKSLGESCIEVRDNQFHYKGASFYYGIEGGRIKVLGSNFNNKVYDINSPHFPAKLQHLFDWSISAG